MAIDKNIMSFEDGLNINIGLDSEFQITTGDICECPDTLIELIPNNDGCLDHKLVVHTDSEFNCDVLIDANLDVSGDTDIGGNVEIDGDLEVNGDVIFNGNVSGIECNCDSSSNTILLYKDSSIINGSILAINGSRELPNQPYVASKKIKITKLKLLIGESDFDINDELIINLYEVKLNGLDGYDINIFGSVTSINNIDPANINLLHQIIINGSDVEFGNRNYRYLTIDVDLETTFIPTALIGNVNTTIHGIDDVFLWIKYNNIEG